MNFTRIVTNQITRILFMNDSNATPKYSTGRELRSIRHRPGIDQAQTCKGDMHNAGTKLRNMLRAVQSAARRSSRQSECSAIAFSSDCIQAATTEAWLNFVLMHLNIFWGTCRLDECNQKGSLCVTVSVAPHYSWNWLSIFSPFKSIALRSTEIAAYRIWIYSSTQMLFF